MSQLTEKQIKAREYYQANKEKICAQKRAKHAAESTVSPTKKVKRVVVVNKNFNCSISAKRTFELIETNDIVVQPKNVDPEKLGVRRRIEDIKLAQEMGVSLAELGAI